MNTQKDYGVSVEVWGDLACFSRPEFRAERISYDVMTPAAARGILESILYKPAIKWIVDEIQVLNPIKTTNFKRVERKEIDTKRSQPEFKKTTSGGERDLRNTCALKDVRYRIKAHFEMTNKAGERDNPGKFLEMFNHRVKTGRCFRQPVFGCKEFPAQFKPVEEEDRQIPKELLGEKDLGYMHYDFIYTPKRKIPQYFRAKLEDGVLNLRDVEVHS